jgi:hypothetical protein
MAVQKLAESTLMDWQAIGRSGMSGTLAHVIPLVLRVFEFCTPS